MRTTLLNAWNWAQAEFSGADLGDLRRSKRLVKVASALAQNPQGALNRAITDWGELIGAYRLLMAKGVSYEAILEPHKQRTRDACRAPGEYLLVEDTTSLDYSALEATTGLGRIGDDGGRGLHLHSTLALRVDGWTPECVPAVTAMGLFDQVCWARTAPTVGFGKEKKARRLKRKRESQRWAAAFERNGGPPPKVRWTYIADRESDIYEVFEKCRSHGVEWIVRANQRRALVEEDGSVFDAVAATAPVGSFSLDLRARPGRENRTARLVVRATTVTLRGPWRPGGSPPPATMNVIEVREEGAPVGVEPIHWVLLTSWFIGSWEAVLRAIKAYTRRWVIEEYHKALKTGASVEESQLMEARGIRSLVGILAVVGLRLLNMKLLAQAEADAPLEPGDVGGEGIAILERKFGRPVGGWSQVSVLIAIARLGGFLARKCDGLPGWLSIWRGWYRLNLMTEGFRLARSP
jgi:hypothetical protein